MNKQINPRADLSKRITKEGKLANYVWLSSRYLHSCMPSLHLPFAREVQYHLLTTRGAVYSLACQLRVVLQHMPGCQHHHYTLGCPNFPRVRGSSTPVTEPN